MNVSTPICSGRLRMRVRRSKLGGWTTTPADRIALLRTCLRLRSLRAPCGEKENNNQKWSHYRPETKIRPCPKIGTSSRTRRTSIIKCLISGGMPDVDADGCPHAYAPGNKGIEDLANATNKRTGRLSGDVIVLDEMVRPSCRSLLIRHLVSLLARLP
jgi:hypothetical protein